MKRRHLRRLGISARGFTLVELMVSLVAGLLVTLAVVSLARTATNTFYEEARLATTESTVRSAAERLRQDLSRASFMSTGNIFLARNDSPSVPFGHKISHTPGAATPSRIPALNNLQGIRVLVQGSLATTPGANAINLLAPDALELTGNFTTDDSYRGRIVGGTTITLVVPTAANLFAGDVAVARLLNSAPNPDTAIRNAFTPGNPAANINFIVRVVDARGCQHFAFVNGGGITATAAGATLTLNTVGGAPPVLTPAEDMSTCGASDLEEVTINPVQRIRWWIGPTTTALEPDPAVEAATNKYDLYRETLDGTGAVITGLAGRQLVAEYAVDLKFGLTVDDPDPAIIPPNNIRVFDMDANGGNSTAVNEWTQVPSTPTLAGRPAPQRVRSVRFRVATRAALPDRRDNLPAIPADPGGSYMTHYCTGPALAGCTRWARVRTMMSEVALMNQVGMTY